jgi:hypothetical protein
MVVEGIIEVLGASEVVGWMVVEVVGWTVVGAEICLQIPAEQTAPAGHSASQSHLSPSPQHEMGSEHNPQLAPVQAWFLQSL